MNQSRVLIVDDSAVILAGLQEIFGHDYTIFTAPEAQKALAILENESIDVIVSDFQMPGMDGLSLLIEVKKRYPAVIRVLMTAYADMQLSSAQ